MKVIVTGGREFWDADSVRCALDQFRPTEIAQGGATGADYLARWWAWGNRVPCRTHLANWRRFGGRAGVIRNEAMWFLEKPDATIAFIGGVGTESMKSIARREDGRLYEVPSGYRGEPLKDWTEIR